jgi:hypothetical protein
VRPACHERSSMAGNEATTEISKKLSENIQYLKERLGIGENNFDVILK